MKAASSLGITSFSLPFTFSTSLSQIEVYLEECRLTEGITHMCTLQELTVTVRDKHFSHLFEQCVSVLRWSPPLPPVLASEDLVPSLCPFLLSSSNPKGKGN